MSKSMARLRVLVGLCALFLVSSFSLPAVSQSQPDVSAETIVDGRPAVANEVLVKMSDNPVYERYVDLEWETDGVSEAVGSQGVRRLRSPWIETADLLADFQTHPDVEYAEPNYVITAAVTPNDSMFSSLWGLLNTGQSLGGQAGTSGADIGATTAWNYSTGSRSIVVGVVDTGIDYNHPDLAANVWSAPAQFTVTIGGQAITCAAGTHGFNAITKTCNPMDDQYHGTHVSGTIGAVGNNGVGVAGVNWVTSLMGLKFLGSNGSGNTADAVNAVEFAIQAKAAFNASSGANVRVLSNSWGGGGYSQAMLDEINKANTNGMLFVAAAGNSGTNNDTTPSYPANYSAPNVIAVAATDNQDHLASFSQYGATTVHLGAPGVTTVSTYPNNSYQSLSGTSMATPHVSGAAALVLSACSLTTAALKTNLLTAVDAIPALSGKTTTGGRLNVGRAMQNCAVPHVSSVTLSADKASPQAVGATVTWTATAIGGSAPLAYEWWTYNGSSWSTAGWTASNTFAWTPSAGGSYQIYVWVKSSGNAANTYEAYTYSAFSVTAAAVSSVALTANKTAPQAPGTTVTFTAQASGGTQPYSYKFWIYDGATWTPSSWTTTNTFAWTPSAANASYQIYAWARSAGNAADMYEAGAAKPFAIASANVPTVTLAANKTAPQAPGTTVTFTATASGGIAPYTYNFFTYDGANWTATGWGATNSFAWTPTTANAGYQVYAWVRNAGNAANTYDAYALTPFAIASTGVSSVTLAANQASPQNRGVAITFTATAAGGTAPYQYQWWVYDGANWSSSAWSASNTWTWTPATANAGYQVMVWVKSAGNAGTTYENYKSVAYAIR
jgi:subtilisin family serine protease